MKQEVKLQVLTEDLENRTTVTQNPHRYRKLHQSVRQDQNPSSRSPCLKHGINYN